MYINLFFNKCLRLFIAAFVITLLVNGCSRDNHYENGKELLSGRKYPEAIAEFQKVQTGDKDFRLAQSKISYIQGLLSFNDSLFQAADLRLQRVEADDEYYHDAQLMLEKISKRNMFSQVPRTDTVFVKEEVSGTKGREKETGSETGKETITAKTDAELTAAYVKQTKSLIEQFESLYQSGYRAPVDSKPNYLTNMSTISGKLKGQTYNAKEKDAEAIELNKKAAAWMNKRVEFISRLIKDNTAAETNTSRSLKEEGDKLYYAVNQQMKKVK
ncbi:MAG: hypothetical protein JNK43_05250 [Ignavibacteria bacterium]|nr:hypothetical protein [Ignavibacteria bacterium]